MLESHQLDAVRRNIHITSAVSKLIPHAVIGKKDSVSHVKSIDDAAHLRLQLLFKFIKGNMSDKQTIKSISLRQKLSPKFVDRISHVPRLGLSGPVGVPTVDQ